MVPADTDPASAADEDRAIREVVPRREVLTELARGFLLVRDAQPDRAVRFAATFLKEQQDARRAPSGAPSSTFPSARRSLGLPRGAVDRNRLEPRS